MNTNNDVELLRLLVRNCAFIVANPAVSAANIPDGKSVGGHHDFFMGARMVLSFGVCVHTLGGLTRLWVNTVCPPCPKCGTDSAFVDFGGSWLSGCGKYERFFCPKCGVGWTRTPEECVAGIAKRVKTASLQRPFILPFEGSDELTLPKELKPSDLHKVFGGKLQAAFNLAALEEVEAFDAMVRDAVENQKAFFATFRLLHDGALGEVCFANINGYAQLFGSAWRGSGGVQVKWDEWWGLLPMLRELATERLAPVQDGLKEGGVEPMSPEEYF